MELKFENPIMVTKSFLPPMIDYINEIERIWNSYWLTNNGEIHNEFEKKLKDYLNVGNVTLFVNGHLALECALKSLDLKGEVITTPFTFASTTHAIVNSGLTPIFCDINLDNFTMDEREIEKLITEKTSAILPVHVFGNPCNVKIIEKIAKKYNLKVIYDAAHTFGVEINGEGIASFGDISMFSMHATKVFHSIEGGLLSYTSPYLKSKLNSIKNFGMSNNETIDLVGTNAKMNEFQAAMGVVNLRYIDSEIQKRKILVQKYRVLLKDIEGIYFLEDQDNVKHNYSYFPILIDHNKFGLNRDDLHERLMDFNVFTRKYFYPLVSNFESYREKYKDIHLPNSNYVAERILTLPLYGDLKVEEVEQICEILKKVKYES